MKRTKVKRIEFAVVMCLFLGFPLVAATSARPLTTVKVNGEKLLGPDYFPDIIMLEAKAKMDGDSFVSGSGSVHGIICGATFFFELSEVTVGPSVTMTGTIVRTNMAHHGSYDWLLGMEVDITANLDGSDMHVTLPDAGLDFLGLGHVAV